MCSNKLGSVIHKKAAYGASHSGFGDAYPCFRQPAKAGIAARLYTNQFLMRRFSQIWWKMMIFDKNSFTLQV
jgi:hypothetical protein